MKNKTNSSSEIPDWAREEPRQFWDPSRRLIRSIRRYQNIQNKMGPVSRLVKILTVLEHRFWSVVCGSDIPLNVKKISGGLLLPHPQGIVIHPETEIGPNCLLFQQVTLGAGKKLGYPILEGHVDVGSGAKICGGVRIGAHAKIGANAVVLTDVPAGATAVGVPARILDKTE